MSNLVKIVLRDSIIDMELVNKLREKYGKLDFEKDHNLLDYYNSNCVEVKTSFLTRRKSEITIPYDDFYNVTNFGKGWKYFLTTTWKYDDLKASYRKLISLLQSALTVGVNEVLLDEKSISILEEMKNVG